MMFSHANSRFSKFLVRYADVFDDEDEFVPIPPRATGFSGAMDGNLYAAARPRRTQPPGSWSVASGGIRTVIFITSW